MRVSGLIDADAFASTNGSIGNMEQLLIEAYEEHLQKVKS